MSDNTTPGAASIPPKSGSYEKVLSRIKTSAGTLGVLCLALMAAGVMKSSNLLSLNDLVQALAVIGAVASGLIAVLADHIRGLYARIEALEQARSS